MGAGGACVDEGKLFCTDVERPPVGPVIELPTTGKGPMEVELVTVSLSSWVQKSIEGWSTGGGEGGEGGEGVVYADDAGL